MHGNHLRKGKSGRDGFSLVEILIVVAIAVSVVFVVVNLSNNANTLQNLVSQKLQSRSDIDQTMQLVTDEIRSAAPSALGAYPLVSASTSSFVFYSDIDQDGITEEVRYFSSSTASSTSFWKGVIKAAGDPFVYASSSETVTDIVDNLISASATPLFSYYDASYTGTSSPMSYPIDISKIRVVKVSFSANVNAKQSQVPEYFSSVIDIRNVRSN